MLYREDWVWVQVNFHLRFEMKLSFLLYLQFLVPITSYPDYTHMYTHKLTCFSSHPVSIMSPKHEIAFPDGILKYALQGLWLPERVLFALLWGGVVHFNSALPGIGFKRDSSPKKRYEGQSIITLCRSPFPFLITCKLGCFNCNFLCFRLWA